MELNRERSWRRPTISGEFLCEDTSGTTNLPGRHHIHLRKLWEGR